MAVSQQAMRTGKMFLIGGSLLALAEYIANQIQNPSLAAIVSFLPISLITCYFIIGRDNMVEYHKSSLRVCVGTLIIYGLFHPILLHWTMNRHIIITIALGMWIVVQYTSYRYLGV